MQRLGELEAELGAEKKARAKLEEDMKRAFMRGVCALNIEVWRPYPGADALLLAVLSWKVACRVGGGSQTAIRLHRFVPTACCTALGEIYIHLYPA